MNKSSIQSLKFRKQNKIYLAIILLMNLALCLQTTTNFSWHIRSILWILPSVRWAELETLVNNSPLALSKWRSKLSMKKIKQYKSWYIKQEILRNFEQRSACLIIQICFESGMQDYSYWHDINTCYHKFWCKCCKMVTWFSPLFMTLSL